MLNLRRGHFLILLAILVPSVAHAATRVSHKRVRAIKIEGTGGAKLQTMALFPDGKLAVLLGPNRYEGITEADEARREPPFRELRIVDDTGKLLTKWKLDFSGQSLAIAPDGTLFVGGDGRLAKFSGAGKLLASVELPHLAVLAANKDALRKRAEEEVKEQKESIAEFRKSIEDQVKSLEKRIARLKERPADELSAADKRRLKSYQSQLDEYKSEEKNFGEELTVEDVMQNILTEARYVNGVTMTEKDVFIVCNEDKGYGFAVWRVNHELANPVKVLSELSGCCGQMDVKAGPDGLFVAENTKHRVGQYDRDGKSIRSFGKRSGDCFGGCCNPMNVCLGPNGDVFTAESEGIIRRFSAQGEPRGPVAGVELKGGCKNVSVAVSADGEKVFLCDLPESQIIVMGRVADDKEAEALGKRFDSPPASGFGGLLRQVLSGAAGKDE